MKKHKVLFADLDGTLIDTISGDTFPKGIWDMRIRFDILDAIKELKPQCMLIVTNQGGIEKGFANRRNFEFKMEYITRSIKEYVGCYTEYSYCESNENTNHYRKPNIGMLESMLRKCQLRLFRPDNLTKDDCLMIGDASGYTSSGLLMTAEIHIVLPDGLTAMRKHSKPVCVKQSN